MARTPARRRRLPARRPRPLPMSVRRALRNMAARS
jgi:hypothetical protein